MNHACVSVALCLQGLVSNTVIDWFFPWPEEALHKVAEFFLADDPLVEDRHRSAILAHMVRSALPNAYGPPPCCGCWAHPWRKQGPSPSSHAPWLLPPTPPLYLCRARWLCSSRPP